MTAAELDRKVRLVELRGRKTVGGLVSGAYRTAFKGQGIEFLEVREYVPGDDTRSIDWNVTARMGRPHLKRFAEEREETVMLVVDGSSSNRFGSGRVSKSEAVAEVYAVLALAAIQNNDRTGLIVFTGEVELYVPPRRSESHVRRLIREILAFKPREQGTNIARALDFLGKARRRRSLVFLISDFLDGGFEAQLKASAKQHDLEAISVFDAREERLPDCGLIELEDAESGVRWLMDSGSAAVRETYERSSRERTERLQEVFRNAGVDHLRVEAGADYFPSLVEFLRVHAKRN
jgi:uncharacterized protein (DUF58 family)